MSATMLMVWEEPNTVPAAWAVPTSVKPQLIFVAGPFRSGTDDDPWLIEVNEAVMTEASLRLFRAGHVPVMGEWLAFPLMEHAGAGRLGDSVFNEIFHPIARRLIEKCDAIVRVGGMSEAADSLVEIAWDLGKTVYLNLDDVPGIPDGTSLQWHSTPGRNSLGTSPRGAGNNQRCSSEKKYPTTSVASAP